MMLYMAYSTRYEHLGKGTNLTIGSLVQWNLDITVTIGTEIPGCYTEVTCYTSDPVMH